MIETLSVDQACEILGCKRRRLFQLLKAGIIERAPRYGRSLRIYRDSIDRALTPPSDARKRKVRAAVHAPWSKGDLAEYLT